MNYLILGIIICIIVIVIGKLTKMLFKFAVVGVCILLLFAVINHFATSDLIEDFNDSLDAVKESETYSEIKNFTQEKVENLTDKAKDYVKDKIIEKLEE